MTCLEQAELGHEMVLLRPQIARHYREARINDAV